MLTIVVVLLLSVALFPYEKRLCERYMLLRSLKRICRPKRYSVRIIKPFGAYFRNYSDPCAFTVDTGKTLYAVSFWNEPFVNSNLIFTKNGNVIRRKKMGEPFSFSGKRTHRVSEKVVTNLKKRKPIEADSRRVVGLFVVLSQTSSLFLFENGQLKKINNGDSVYDMTVVTKESIFTIIGK